MVQKPKVHPWYILLQNPRHPLGPLTCNNFDDYPQVPLSEPSPHHLARPLIKSKLMFTSHNHQRSTSTGQDNPPPDFITRPSIKCNSHSLLIIIRGGTQQVKQPIPTLVRQDLQPRANQKQLLTTIRGEAPHNRRKPYQMGDKTFN